MLPALLLLFSAGPPTMRGIDLHGGRLPWGAVQRLGTLRWRHSATEVFFSPDGKTVFCQGPDGVRAWERGTGKPVAGLSDLLAVRFLPDGKTLAAVRPGKRGRFDPRPPVTLARLSWPAMEGEATVLKGADTHGRGRWLVAPDGYSVCSSKHGDLVIHEERTGKSSRPSCYNLRGDYQPVYSPDGKWIAVFADDGMRLFSSPSGETGPNLGGRRGVDDNRPRGKPAFSPDGHLLAYATPDHLLLFDLRTKRRIAHRRGPVAECAFSPDGKSLALAEAEGITLLDPRTLQTRRVLRRGDEPVAAVAFSPDGKALAVATEQRVSVFDALTGRQENADDGHDTRLQAVAFSPDGAVATGDEAGQVRIWHPGRRPVWAGPAGWGVMSLAFSQDGRTLALGEGDTWPAAVNRSARFGAIRLIDAATGAEKKRLSGHLGGVVSLLFAPGGKTLASGGADGRVRWWDPASGKLLGQVRHLDDPQLMGFVGGRILVHQTDGGLAVVGKDGEPERFGPEPGYNATLSGALSTDGRHAIAQRFHKVEWYDLATRKLVRSVSFDRFGGSGDRQASPDAVAVSPDGAVVAHIAGSIWDQRVYLIDLATRQIIAAMPVKGRYLSRVLAFSPDGRWLAASETTTTALVWDVHRLHAQAVLSGWLSGKQERALLAGLPEGVRAFTTRLERAARAEAEAAKWLRLLDSEDFEDRQKAEDALRDMGPAAAPFLEKEAAKPRSTDVGARVRRLLKDIPIADRKRWADEARLRSALALLARSGWQGSRAALERLTKAGGMIGLAAREALK
jgi:WD40 repeat protein